MKNHSKTFRILLALGIIFLTIFIGINGDNQIFGYKLISIFYLFMIIGITITVLWFLINDKSKISISKLKEEFKIYKISLNDVKNLPDNYKNIVLIGYFSIILIFLGLFFDLLSNLLYGTINGNWGGPLTIIILFLGIILYFYSWIKILLKLRKLDEKFPLQIHFNLIWLLLSICILLNIILSNLKLI